MPLALGYHCRHWSEVVDTNTNELLRHHHCARDDRLWLCWLIVVVVAVIDERVIICIIMSDALDVQSLDRL